jgi:LPXTG-motif cell wall-anchored protein
MRSILAVLLTAGAVSFGGAAVANATPVSDLSGAPLATSTTTILAADGADDDGDDTGLWGLAGLLGLLGLLGLKRRNDVDGRVNSGTAPGRGTNPRA